MNSLHLEISLNGAKIGSERMCIMRTSLINALLFNPVTQKMIDNTIDMIKADGNVDSRTFPERTLYLSFQKGERGKSLAIMICKGEIGTKGEC